MVNAGSRCHVNVEHWVPLAQQLAPAGNDSVVDGGRMLDLQSWTMVAYHVGRPITPATL